MTGKELVDYITELGLEDWYIEAKYHGEVFEVVGAARQDGGMIRLYPREDQE